MTDPNEPSTVAPERMVTVQIPEALAREALARWAELTAHPAADGRARRYTAAQAIRAAARVGLASLAEKS